MAEEESGLGTSFEEVVAPNLQTLNECIDKLGERLRSAVNTFNEAFKKTAKILDSAKEIPKPDEEELYELLSPVAQEMELVAEVKDGVLRKDLLEHHIVSLAEAVRALEWLSSEDPLPILAEGKSLLMDSLEPLKLKGSRGDPVHADWAQSLESIFINTENFVKEFCPKGIPWKES